MDIFFASDFYDGSASISGYHNYSIKYLASNRPFNSCGGENLAFSWVSSHLGWIFYIAIL